MEGEADVFVHRSSENVLRPGCGLHKGDIFRKKLEDFQSEANSLRIEFIVVAGIVRQDCRFDKVVSDLVEARGIARSEELG